MAEELKDVWVQGNHRLEGWAVGLQSPAMATIKKPIGSGVRDSEGNLATSDSTTGLEFNSEAPGCPDSWQEKHANILSIPGEGLLIEAGLQPAF